MPYYYTKENLMSSHLKIVKNINDRNKMIISEN